MEIYRAVIEDNNDPTYQNRVRVRVIGRDTGETGSDFQNVQTSQLPWAEVMGSTDFGLISGVGVSSILRQGTWVWVIFEDDDPNRPIVLGVVHGIANNVSASGFNDPDGVYPKSDRKGQPDIHPDMAGDKYLTMQMIETPCGHTIELDDTEGDQRIKITHVTGSYIFIDNEGNIFVNGVKNAQYDIAENVTWNIGQNLTVNVGEDATYHITGNRTETVGEDSSYTISGNRTESVSQNSSYTISGNRDESVNGNSSYNINGTRSETVGSSSSMTIGSSLTVNCGSSASITATSVTSNAPTTSCTGNLGVSGTLTAAYGSLSANGSSMTFNGSFRATNDVVGNGVSLSGHTHTGVHGETSTPH